MARLQTMIITHGNRKPIKKRNFFGDFPSFLSIVQEKDSGSSPSLPQTSSKGGTIIPKENNHRATIMIYRLHLR